MIDWNSWIWNLVSNPEWILFLWIRHQTSGKRIRIQDWCDRNGVDREMRRIRKNPCFRFGTNAEVSSKILKQLRSWIGSSFDLATPYISVQASWRPLHRSQYHLPSTFGSHLQQKRIRNIVNQIFFFSSIRIASNTSSSTPKLASNKNLFWGNT